MNIGILGGGQVGSALAQLARSAGHSVCIGQRNAAQREDGVPVLPMAAACAQADLVIIAIPFTACAEALPALNAVLAGKTVVDATNPLQADWSPLLLGAHDSAAQQIAALLPAARVVKAFNTVFADVMNPHGQLRAGGSRITVFVASDDTSAADLVAALASDLGFATQRVGALAHARFLEAMAHLNIAIAVGQGGGTNAAFIYDQASAKQP